MSIDSFELPRELVLQYRKINITDYDSIIEMILILKRKQGELSRERFGKLIEDRSSLFVCGSLNDYFVSFGSLHISENIRCLRLGYLEDLYVREEFRGKGLGHELVDVLLSLASQMKCDRVLLNSDEHNLDFYKKLGAKLSGTTLRFDVC